VVITKNIRICMTAEHWWLTPIILATKEAEIRRITVRSQPEQIVWETLSWKKPFTKIKLVEWLKVKALSSCPSTTKKKKNLYDKKHLYIHIQHLLRNSLTCLVLDILIMTWYLFWRVTSLFPFGKQGMGKVGNLGALFLDHLDSCTYFNP
jgi:hypothetical protein